MCKLMIYKIIELNQFHDREIYQRILFLYQRCHFYRQIRVFVVIWSCIITGKAVQAVTNTSQLTIFNH